MTNTKYVIQDQVGGFFLQRREDWDTARLTPELAAAQQFNSEAFASLIVSEINRDHCFFFGPNDESLPTADLVIRTITVQIELLDQTESEQL